MVRRPPSPPDDEVGKFTRRRFRALKNATLSAVLGSVPVLPRLSIPLSNSRPWSVFAELRMRSGCSKCCISPLRGKDGFPNISFHFRRSGWNRLHEPKSETGGDMIKTGVNLNYSSAQTRL